MDTLPLKPQRLAELEDYARRRGKTTADALDALADYLEWVRQDYEEAVIGIRQGREQMKAGLGRPAEEFLSELRRKHDLSH